LLPEKNKKKKILISEDAGQKRFSYSWRIYLKLLAKKL